VTSAFAKPVTIPARPRRRPHRLAATILALTMVATASAAPPRPVAPKHPLLGSWKFTLPGNGCVEAWLIKPDGTSFVTSGDEVVETQLDVSDRPDARGAYRWVDKVVKSNGRTDCGDSVTPVGTVGTNYIRFDPTGDRMALCHDEALRECIGPYLRVRPPGSSTKL